MLIFAWQIILNLPVFVHRAVMFSKIINFTFPLSHCFVYETSTSDTLRTLIRFWPSCMV